MTVPNVKIMMNSKIFNLDFVEFKNEDFIKIEKDNILYSKGEKYLSQESLFYKTLIPKLSIYITKFIDILNFYEFIGIESKFIKKIVKIIGEILETINYDILIPTHLTQLFKKYYPSIMYDSFYRKFFSNVEDSKIYKHISPFAICNIDYFSAKNNINFEKYKNGIDEKVYFWIKNKNSKIAKLQFTNNLSGKITTRHIYMRTMAILAIYHECKNFLVYLSKIGFDLDTIIKNTCLSGNLKMVKFLNGRINVINYKGFRNALKSKNFELVKYFGQNIEKKLIDEDLINITCTNNNLDYFKYLLKFIVLDDKILENFFFYAYSSGSNKIIVYLFDNFNIIVKNIEQVLFSTLKNDYSETAKIIMDKFNIKTSMRYQLFNEAAREYKPSLLMLLSKDNPNFIIRSNIVFINLIKTAKINEDYAFILFTIERFKDHYFESKDIILYYIPLHRDEIAQKMCEIFSEDSEMCEEIRFRNMEMNHD